MLKMRDIMNKKVKKIIKIISIPIIIFILGNLGIYIYCFLTPKMEINKSQSYYLYDNESKLVSQTNDEWIPLDKISKNVIDATISTEDKYFYKKPPFIVF